ncbi:response regulator [bacterium]|nr:response regulator [bacterium]
MSLTHTPRLFAAAQLEGQEGRKTFLAQIEDPKEGFTDFFRGERAALVYRPVEGQSERWMEYYTHGVSAAPRTVEAVFDRLSEKLSAPNALWKGPVSLESEGRLRVFLAAAAQMEGSDVILFYGEEVSESLARQFRDLTLSEADHLLFFWDDRLVASEMDLLPEQIDEYEQLVHASRVLRQEGVREARPVALRLDEVEFLTASGVLVSPGAPPLAETEGKHGLAYVILKSKSGFEKELRQLDRELLLIAAFGLALAVVIAVFVSSGLVRPIDRLVDFVTGFSQGQMERRLNLHQFHGEFSHLARAFDAMQVSLLEKNRQLVESGRLYRTLIENSTQAITGLFPAGGKMFAANRAFATLTGYGPGGTRAAHLSAMLLPEDNAFALELLARLESEGLVSQQARMRRRDGSEIFVDLRLSVVERSPQTTALAILSDETEKRTLERQLIQSQKMESLETLAGGVAHDFNNLLTAIIGFSTMALKEVKESDSVYNYLKQVERAGERAKELTHNLLSFGRRKDMRPRPTNLNQVVEEAVQLLSRTLDKSIEIRTRLANNLDVVEADPGQMDQVLMNLCINARDAMPAGGSITLETRNHLIDEEYCRTRQDAQPGAYVRLSVTDTGVGMDKETQKRIFEPFFTTKEVGKGTGLGLSIVYGIVKAHHGLLAVYSEPGQGTTFAIDLPAVDKAVKRDGRQDEVVRGGHERILLVDDEEPIRALAGQVLAQLGYHVEMAANGREALHKLESSPAFDLVVLDLVMPEMSGRELFDALVARNCPARTLIASGYSMHERSQDLLDRGADDFIQKPFRPDDLGRKVREILDRGRPK